MAKAKDTTRSEGYNGAFPTRLRELLERPDETQARLADYLGVKRQSVGYWKDGVTAPDVNMLAKISEYYKVSADYLIGRAECKKPVYEEVYRMTGLSGESLKVLNEKKYNTITRIKEDGEDLFARKTPAQAEKSARGKKEGQVTILYVDHFIKAINALIENPIGVKAVEDLSQFLFGDFVNVDRVRDTDTGAHFRYKQNGQEAMEILEASRLNSIYFIEMQEKLFKLKEQLRNDPAEQRKVDTIPVS